MNEREIDAWLTIETGELSNYKEIFAIGPGRTWVQICGLQCGHAFWRKRR